jgi:hypothetical protein
MPRLAMSAPESGQLGELFGKIGSRLTLVIPFDSLNEAANLAFQIAPLLQPLVKIRIR